MSITYNSNNGTYSASSNLPNDALIRAKRFNDLKALIQSKCAARHWVNSVSEYSIINFNATPDDDVIVANEHFNKLREPLNAINSNYTNLPSASDNDTILDSKLLVLEQMVTSLSDDMHPTTQEASGCNALCTGTCMNTCEEQCASCRGQCDYNCGDSCSNSCGDSCSGYCTRSCAGDCTNGCYRECNTGCWNDCMGTCGHAFCDGEGCSGICTSTCSNRCFESCDQGCNGGCSGNCGSGCSANGCYIGCDEACHHECSDACQRGCRSSCWWDCTSGCSNSCTGTNKY